jgi:hypothetical protein
MTVPIVIIEFDADGVPCRLVQTGTEPDNYVIQRRDEHAEWKTIQTFQRYSDWYIDELFFAMIDKLKHSVAIVYAGRGKPRHDPDPYE